MRTVVVGASSGLGRCIGIGLAQRGAHTALLARRQQRLEAAAEEAGPGTLAITCDVTSTESCQSAVNEAAEGLGGIDALVYAPGIGPLARLADMDAETWRRIFDTNVIGASLVTAAAMPHLTESSGTAVYLSSVSASSTPPWPGLGAYAVSKAALDKLVEAWRGEHPTVGFTRVVVGECMGGEGDSMPEFAERVGSGARGGSHAAVVRAQLHERCFRRDRGPHHDRRLAPAPGGAVAIPSVTVSPRMPG